MQLHPKTENVTITILGSFTPSIFRPTWFAKHKLISLDEIDESERDLGSVIVVENLTNFNLSNWLTISVERHRFQAATNQPPKYEALRDVVAGTFRILSQTPLQQMGINHEYHYQLPSKEIWDNLGHRLAPKEDWKRLLVDPGMMTLEIKGNRNDDYNGYYRVKVQSENPDQFGVSIHVNDHYELRSGSSEEDFSLAKSLMQEILLQNWQESSNIANKIASKISTLSMG